MAALAMNPVEMVETVEVAPVARPVRRWLHVVSHTDPRYGGLSAAVPAVVAGLAGSGAVEASLAAFCRAGEEVRPAGLAAMGDGAVSFWPASRGAWWRERGLAARFEELVRGVDGLHVHGLWEESTAMACRVARRLGKPYVLSAHGMLEPWALGTKRLKKQVYAALVERANVRGAACLQALTRAEAAQYRGFGARGPVAVIPNAVALPEEVGPELFLERFPELRGRRVVLFLSRLHPKKGLDLLVEGWARVSGAHPEARLVIAGPDDEGMEAGLRRRAAELGVAEGICFTGMLAGAMKWSALRAAEAYVLPSYSEGLSMALLEAMGVGAAVIATRGCNMPEITEAGAGWEIEARVEDVAGALAQMLRRSPERNRAMGAKGARLIRERYTPEGVLRATAAMYAFAMGDVARPTGLELMELPLGGGAR